MICTKQEICVATNELDQPINITKFTIDSEKPGKFVYIQGGVHGGEVTLPIIKNVYNYLQKNLVSGKVVFVPYANPLAWQQKAYTYTVGKFSLKNGKDFNRCYETNGDINSKIASTIFEQCKGADFTLDLHTAHNSMPHTIFASLKLLPYIKQINLKFNNLCGMPDKFKGCFDYELTLKDIPSITIECGAHDDVNENNIKMVTQGILNVLANFNMIKPIAVTPTKQIYYEQSTSIKTPVSGIANYCLDLNSNFKKGDKLFEIISADLAKPNYCYYAEEDGILFRKSRTHIFCAYDEVLQVIYNKNAKDSL